MRPLAEIEKERKPFIGMLASESERRTVAYLHTGCNAYKSRKPRSMPLAKRESFGFSVWPFGAKLILTIH